MKNSEVFTINVDESAEIKTDIKDHYKPRLGSFKKMFKHAFGEEPKDFALLLDCHYLIGGIPKETSRPKLGTLLQQIAKIVTYYDYLGKKGELDRILGGFGLKVEITQPGAFRYTKSEKFIDEWRKTFPELEVPETGQDLLNTMLTEGCVVKKTIDEMEFEINEEKAMNVQDVCEVLPKVFKTAVGLKVKKSDGKDAETDVQNLSEFAHEVEEVFTLI